MPSAPTRRSPSLGAQPVAVMPKGVYDQIRLFVVYTLLMRAGTILSTRLNERLDHDDSRYVYRHRRFGGLFSWIARYRRWTYRRSRARGVFHNARVFA